MEFHTETTMITFSVSGRHENKKNEMVNHRFILESSIIEDLFDRLCSEYGNFETSVREIPLKLSKKYQAVGIESLFHEELSNGGYVYRAVLRYVFRDRVKMWLTDYEKKQSRSVKIGGTEFPSIVVCASYYLSDSSLLVDRRGTLGPLSSFLKQSLSQYIENFEYGLDDDESMEEAFAVKITQDLHKDYEEKIDKYFSDISKIAFTFSKPSKRRIQNLNKSDTKAPKFVPTLLGNILGMNDADAQFANLPIKTLAFSLRLDPSYGKKKLKKIRAAAKDAILEQVTAAYVSGSTVEFEGDEGMKDIEKAIKRGIAQVDIRELDSDPFDDSRDFYDWHDDLKKVKIKKK